MSDEAPDFISELGNMLNMLMDFDIEQGMWDFPPMLYVVTDPMPDNPDKWRIHPFQISGHLWSIHPDPVVVMEILAKAVAMPEAPLPPIGIEDGEKVRAVVLRNEGWGLKGIDAEEYEAWRKEHPGSRMVDHPNAVETKIVSAYVPDQERGLSVHHVRNSERDRTILPNEGRIHDTLGLVYEAVVKRYEVGFA